MIGINYATRKSHEKPTRIELAENPVENICLKCPLPPCNGTCKRYGEEKRKLLKSTS